MYPTSISDEYFIDETLKLAKKAMGWTNPNPMVGAVIVKDGQIIAWGYHRRVGLPHAEIEALKATKTSMKGATLYVNLEPCTHYGRTPPCVDAIIQAGIRRVVCSTPDPNPKVHGHGIAKLKRAGITVSVGLREKESRVLNEAFFTFHEKKRPFIAIKFAASLDGKIATHTGDSKWITSEKARLFARRIRSKYQAILVGINTVMRDNPHLGVRSPGKKDPVRIILDSNLQIPLNSQVLRDNNVLVVTTARASKNKQEQLKRQGIPILAFESEKISLKELLSSLQDKEIISILVEGGGKILGSFVDEKLVDKLYVFCAPTLIGGEKAVTIGGRGVNKIKNALRLERISIRRFQDDFLVIGSPS